MNRLVEDRQLCRKFKRGSKSALVQVYRDYAPELVVFLKNGFVIQGRDGEHFFPGYRNDDWALENAVQEIFVRCFQKRARDAYDGIRPFKNYLFTIARNYVIDEFRKQRSQKDVAVQSIESFAGDGESNPHAGTSGAETLLQDAQLRHLVSTFVAELDDKHRAVFQWRFQKGVSIEHAAKGIGTTEYRIKKAERHIRRAFYDLLTKHGYLEDMPFRAAKTQGTLLLLLVVLYPGGVRP